MDFNRRVRVGSRKSQLALVQTNFIVNSLRTGNPDVQFDIVTIVTVGDQILDKPLAKIGEKSLFTKELEVALLDGTVDFVVHSLKDLPTALPDGVAIGAIGQREDPSDAVVMRSDFSNLTLEQLPKGCVVGTCSLRRIAQLKRSYPHLSFESVRGNLDTRLRKLEDIDGIYSALILASAGLIRMGWHDRISQRLSSDICLYAVGQGALAVEVRSDDVTTRKLISTLNHAPTILCCVAERAFLRTLEGGCSVPIAVHSEIVDDKVLLQGGVFSLDGLKCVTSKHSINESDLNASLESETEVPIVCGVQTDTVSAKELRVAEMTGVQLAGILLKQGAKDILVEVRTQNESGF